MNTYNIYFKGVARQDVEVKAKTYKGAERQAKELLKLGLEDENAYTQKWKVDFILGPPEQ